MNAQEIFDTVVTHLYTQGKQAGNGEGGCLYRTDEGLKCAVGCLIPYDQYHHSMEGRTVESLQSLLPPYLLPHQSLLTNLQGVHDAPSSWTDADVMVGSLRRIAWKEGLSDKVLEGKRLTNVAA
jgi:hypothetical protein